MLRLSTSASRGHRAFLTLALALAARSAAAQSPLVCPPEPRPPSPVQIEEGLGTGRDRGFLWRVSRADQTSYLYGTVHVGRQEWMFPGREVMHALRSTEVVALELDVLDPDLIERLQRGMALRPGHGLPEVLNARLRAQLRVACLPEQMLNTTAPEVVAATLTLVSGRAEGLDPSYAVDTVYAGLARRLKKTVSSLETPEQQLEALLARTPEEAQTAVESALNDLEQGLASPMVDRMARVWADGRLGELEDYARWCRCLRTPAERSVMKRLLDDRNPGLAAGIDAIHASGRPVFAAVGSLHMIGPTGLPALLAARAYKVERVDFEPWIAGVASSEDRDRPGEHR